MLNLTDIQAAQTRIAGRVHRTPVMTSRAFNTLAGAEVFFKCENLQRAGAFKMRGATNKILLLSEDERRRGVVAFSSGNHAQAVTLAAREANVRATIVMPHDAPQIKVTATKNYGATVITYDRLREDREQIARDLAEREGLTLVPPFDDELIMAGQGTCALELLEDAPDLDCLVTPCGGGGLFAGASIVMRAANPDALCYAVEPANGNDAQQSFRAGERISIPPPDTIADGLRTQALGEHTFPVLQRNATDVLAVTDDELVATMKFLLFRMKLLVEPSGAAAAAAVMHGKIPATAKRIGVILSGGNVDQTVLAKVLS